jgi:hypothetical protein
MRYLHGEATAVSALLRRCAVVFGIPDACLDGANAVAAVGVGATVGAPLSMDIVARDTLLTDIDTIAHMPPAAAASSSTALLRPPPPVPAARAWAGFEVPVYETLALSRLRDHWLRFLWVRGDDDSNGNGHGHGHAQLCATRCAAAAAAVGVLGSVLSAALTTEYDTVAVGVKGRSFGWRTGTKGDGVPLADRLRGRLLTAKQLIRQLALPYLLSLTSGTGVDGNPSMACFRATSVPPELLVEACVLLDHCVKVTEGKVAAQASAKGAEAGASDIFAVLRGQVSGLSNPYLDP